MFAQENFSYPISMWLLAFIVFIVLTIVDLLCVSVNGGNDRVHDNKKSWMMVSLGIAMTVVWGITIAIYKGIDDATAFFTGYLLELTLSVDNIFVFMLIFSAVKLEEKYQHKVLFIGIISAVVLRFIMIIFGIMLTDRYQWIFYIFAVIMIIAGYKIAFKKEEDEQENTNDQPNVLISIFSKFMPISNNNAHFIVKENGKWHITYSLIALILIEKADVIFAIDSVPAVLSITKEPFIVFISNIYAIMGLRSLYTIFIQYAKKIKYLNQGVGVILFMIAIKMSMLPMGLHISPFISLLLVVTVMIGTGLFSWYRA